MIEEIFCINFNDRFKWSSNLTLPHTASHRTVDGDGIHRTKYLLECGRSVMM
jgi:hypothetical protein